MIENRFFGLLSSILFLGIVMACQSGKDPGPEATGVYDPTPYDWKKPANFPEPVYDFSKNPMTRKGVALGKMLFFDGALSRDGRIACGFCHQQYSAFAHADHSLSHGIDDKIGTRNVRNLQNVAWSTAFFWDGSITDLDTLAISPIQNPLEMGEHLGNVLDKVRRSSSYPARFKEAFGTEQITQENFLKALSQFMLTMVSANSRYDKYVRKEPGGDLSADELAGLSLFKQQCSGCHQGELFTDQGYHNNGLPVSEINDQGRFEVTKKETDRLKFLVPSLRNIERSLPYMHDGRFWSLEQVLDHYSQGVKDSPTLDSRLKTGGVLGIALSEPEKKQIIAFLKTLTDQQFITDRQFIPN
ncbi:cytochrome-c peroxidase [Larkinella sp. GY13]|uniref:cytochrome-c peroxidase n=1 Tax=Larkinella sp. GY13 TaxID=3453720 RepID=UPI003EEAC80E